MLAFLDSRHACAPSDRIEQIWDDVAWATRTSKGGLTVRDALGMHPFAPLSAWHVRQFKGALGRLLEKEAAEAEAARNAPR